MARRPEMQQRDVPMQQLLRQQPEVVGCWVHGEQPCCSHCHHQNLQWFQCQHQQVDLLSNKNDGHSRHAVAQAREFESDRKQRLKHLPPKNHFLADWNLLLVVLQVKSLWILSRNSLSWSDITFGVVETSMAAGHCSNRESRSLWCSFVQSLAVNLPGMVNLFSCLLVFGCGPAEFVGTQANPPPESGLFSPHLLATRQAGSVLICCLWASLFKPRRSLTNNLSCSSNPNRFQHASGSHGGNQPVFGSWNRMIPTKTRARLPTLRDY